MRNNPTAYKHPTIQRKIKIAAMRAWFQARKPNGKGFAKEYVANRNGWNIMRIDYVVGQGFRIWGDQSRDITAMIVPIINKDFL